MLLGGDPGVRLPPGPCDLVELGLRKSRLECLARAEDAFLFMAVRDWRSRHLRITAGLDGMSPAVFIQGELMDMILDSTLEADPR